ncbi:MAG: hypothetical protein M0006_10665 [Magnetospirillum sp.]|nr:hypothetical protein [Magnetospirillum sp.]
MTARPIRLVMALAAVLALGACESKPPVQKLPPISFAGKAPIQLDVGQLEIVSEYQPPGHAPNYEHLMQISPGAAAVQWAKDRLKPMGRTGYAHVVIRDASVIRTALKTDKGITGLFKEEQGERYDGSLDVVIQIQDERHMTLGEVEARATRSRTVPEGATVNERDRDLYEITEGLVRDVDSQMDGLIHGYLARWVLQQ